MPSSRRDQLERQLADAQRMQVVHAVLLIQAITSSVRINPLDLQCLNLLTLRGPLPPSRLADEMSLTKGGAITAMIDRLERAGYVHRRRDSRDRRQVLVHLTPGEPLQQLLAQFHPIAEAIADLSADYTDDQLELIIDYLDRGNDLIHTLRGRRARPEDPTRTSEQAS